MKLNTAAMQSRFNPACWRRRPQPRLRLFATLLLAPCLLLLAGCGPYPRDPEDTTQRVSSGVMRVGVSHDPPFVQLREDAAPQGSDIERVKALAKSLEARVVWVPGSHAELLEDLEHFRLDLVVGGLAPQSPWKKRVALTRPYDARDAKGHRVQRVMAVAPGENRWQLRVERFNRADAARARVKDAQ